MNEALQANDTTFPGIWDELMWRGLIDTTTDDNGLRQKLNTERVAFYCGFDPTASSLHVGNLMQILVMRRLQLAGHTPLALVGGATGLIGDPRPSAERTLNNEETIAEWVMKLSIQLSRFLSTEGDNAVKMVNNLDWFSGMSALSFLRDTGKHFRVNTMMKKDAVSNRLKSNAGISFTEFSYQILQAGDFLELFRRENCILQTGGSDQWGNMVGGVDLVHRVEGSTVHAMSTSLVLNSDGTKFGKSEGNAVWLDGAMLSPFEFFQFWLNTPDADVVDRLKVFTFLTRAQIAELAEQVSVNPSRRDAQKRLAWEVTALVHGSAAADDVETVSRILFSSEDLATVPLPVLSDAAASLGEHVSVPGETVAELCVRVGAVESLSATRRLVKQKGLSLNNVLVADADHLIAGTDFIHSSILMLRKGKKQLFAVKKVDSSS